MRREKGSILMMAMPLAVILFMSIGIYVFNSSNSTIERAASQMSQQENNQQNSTLEKYKGSRKSSSEVKTMIDEIINNNNLFAGEDEGFIELNYYAYDKELEGIEGLSTACFDAKFDNTKENVEKASKEMENLKKLIPSNSQYTIEITYGIDGKIEAVTITEEEY